MWSHGNGWFSRDDVLQQWSGRPRCCLTVCISASSQIPNRPGSMPYTHHTCPQVSRIPSRRASRRSRRRLTLRLSASRSRSSLVVQARQQYHQDLGIGHSQEGGRWAYDGLTEKRSTRAKQILPRGFVQLWGWDADPEFEEPAGEEWINLHAWRWDPRRQGAPGELWTRASAAAAHAVYTWMRWTLTHRRCLTDEE